MADGTDFTVLRRAVEIATADLSDMNTHATLNEVFRHLGLPDHQGSKRERVSGSIAALPDADLPALAQRILEQVAMKPAARNALQDALWAHQNPIQIPKRTRRDIARALDATNFVYDANRFMTLLDRCWVLDDELDGWLMGENPNGLRAQIMQHVIRNPEDWPAEMLFERLGAFDAGDARFARFLEGLASADAVPDEPTQRSIVEAVNPQLRSIGAVLHETGTDGGYPVFSLISTRAARAGRPKNLIFASPEKPDIRFRDAIDNEIEIVTNADRVLVYDRPIGADGI